MDKSPPMTKDEFRRWFEANFYAWASSAPSSTKKHWLRLLRGWLEFAEMEFHRPTKGD